MVVFGCRNEHRLHNINEQEVFLPVLPTQLMHGYTRFTSTVDFHEKKINPLAKNAEYTHLLSCRAHSESVALAVMSQTLYSAKIKLAHM